MKKFIAEFRETTDGDTVLDNYVCNVDRQREENVNEMLTAMVKDIVVVPGYKEYFHIEPEVLKAFLPGIQGPIMIPTPVHVDDVQISVEQLYKSQHCKELVVIYKIYFKS